MIRNSILAIFIILFSSVREDSFMKHTAAAWDTITLQPEESIINAGGKNILTRFNAPAGYVRKEHEKNSFANYLRNLPLKEAGAIVKYFDGQEKNDLVHDAVIDMDVGNKDLQQCADAIMRLRAEYFNALGQFDKISFTLTNGFRMDYSEWMEGNRLAVTGNKTRWIKSAAPSQTYHDFRKYLEIVFTYAGTLSLSKALHPKDIAEIAIGDVFIRGGSPGHAVIVVDVAESRTGGKVFMVAQSFMPAQEIHILKNYGDERISPWYKNSIGELNTPQWNFAINELKSFD